VRRPGRRALATAAFAGSLMIAIAAAPIAASSALEPGSSLPPGELEVADGLEISKPTGAATEGLSARLAALSSQALRDESARARALAVSLRPNGAGSLIEAGGRLVVSARVATTSSSLLDRVRDAGAEVLGVHDDYLTLDLVIAVRDLRGLADVDGVELVSEAIEPIVGGNGAGLSGPGSAAPRLNTCTGAIVSEADSQMRAIDTRAAFDIDGLGTKVGVVSDSFDTRADAATRAAGDVTSGDLPGPGNPCGRTTPVQVLAETANGIDEGRAMAQLVHDLAPGAALAFATSGPTAEAMADNIRALRAAGSTVIVDDITFFDEPMYQDGPISNAVTEVVGAGVPYYSSAANSNVISQFGVQAPAGQNIASYEASSFRSAGACLGAGTNCHDFDPGGGVDFDSSILLDGGRSVRFDFQWAQPRNGVDTDFDFYVVDVAAGTIVAAGAEDNFASQKPFEFINLQNPTGAPREYAVVIDKFAGPANPRLKWVMLGGGGVSGAEWDVSLGGDVVGPTIFGHNGAANAVSTAAVPFDNASTLETFSSRGPVTLLFGPVSGTTPAAAFGAPQVLAKPDLAATDNAQTTFFQPSGGIFRFSGTSAAAPHAAAVAALQLDAANGALTVAQVVAAQKATAFPIGSFGADAAGAGLVDAVGSVSANPPQPPDTVITKMPKNKIRKKRATYKFASNAPEATFKCKIDRDRFRRCGPTTKVKRIPFGRHKLVVKAVANGLTDPSPAKDKFKRKR